MSNVLVAWDSGEFADLIGPSPSSTISSTISLARPKRNVTSTSVANALASGGDDFSGDDFSGDDSSGDDETYKDEEEVDTSHKLAAHLLNSLTDVSKNSAKAKTSSTKIKSSTNIKKPLILNHVSNKGMARNYSRHATPEKYKAKNLKNPGCPIQAEARRNEIREEYAHDPDFMNILIKRVNSSHCTFRANANQMVFHENYDTLTLQVAQLKLQIQSFEIKTTALQTQIQSLKKQAVFDRAMISDQTLRLAVE